MFNVTNLLKGDKTLWYVTIALMIASLMVVYSSTGKLAYNQQSGNTSHYLIKQSAILLICFISILFVQSIHYKYFLRLALIILILSLGFLLLAKYMGVTLNSAGRWLPIPFTGLTFQPSELAKIGVVLYTARVISFHQTDWGCSTDVLYKLALFVGPVLLVIFSEGFSSFCLFAAVCMIMLFIGRVSIKVLLSITASFLLLVAIVFFLALKFEPIRKIGRLDTAVSRVETFFHPTEVSEDASYQSIHSKIAVARGGLMGVGPGNSTQRNFLPHPYSDFIFAIIIEEYGLIGALFVMLLYLIILYRVGVIVRRCTRMFPALLVAGLGLFIVIQALMNMGVCVGLLPVTGQPLPLISLGGTSLILTGASLGMILSVSYTFSEEGIAEEQKRKRRKEAKQKRKEFGDEINNDNIEDIDSQINNPLTV